MTTFYGRELPSMPRAMDSWIITGIGENYLQFCYWDGMWWQDYGPKKFRATPFGYWLFRKRMSLKKWVI